MANKEFDNVQLFAEYDSSVGSNVVNVFGNKPKENIAYSLSKIKNWFPWLVPTNGSAGQILEWYNNVPTWRANINADTVKQTHSTDTDFHPLVLGAPHSASAWGSPISETTDQVYMNKGVYVKPSTSTIYATDYRGKINGFSLIGTEGSTYNLDAFITSQFISSITTTGSGNGVTAIGVNNGVMTVTKGLTFELVGHTHPLSIATDTGNSQLSMSANTKYKLTAGGSTFIFTTPPDSDTKVTSSTNHYTPATASGQDKTASASGATAAWSIDVVKGVTLNTDGKGHVTGISVTPGKIPANPVPSNNVTGSGTSGYLTKWSGTNTITNGPQLGSSTTTFLRNDGTWATPVNSGIVNKLAYYSGENAISPTPQVGYYEINSTASTPVSRKILDIRGTGVGNTAAELISGTAGLLTYGDGGPQINFGCGATMSTSGSQEGALIYTDHDSAATGVSWHFVSNQSDWNVTSKRFHARTSISIGSDLPSTSYNLTVKGTSYFDNTITIKGTSSGNASIYYASYGNTRNSTSIRFYDGDVNGQGIQIGGGGLTVVGGGESAQTVFDNLSTLGWNASSEVAVVASDGPIYFMTNCDTFANRKSINIDTTGYLNTGYINMNVSDQDNLFSTASSIVYSNSDKYLRRVSLTKLGSLLGPLVIQDYLPSYGYRSASGFTYLQTADDFGGTDGARNNPNNHFAHYLIANHGNGQTYYHYTLRLPFWSTPQYQRKTGGSTETENRTRWFNFLTEETGAAKPNYCAFPTDGFYSASTSTVTGAMVITLPIGFTAIMLQFTVEIFDYITNKSCMYRISGYVYDVDSKWYNVTATCISGYGYDSNAHRAHNLKVRFGRNSTSGKAQIQIGEIDTIWDWPGVQIRDVLMTHNTVQFDTISQGWSITFQSSANIDNVSNTVDSDYVATYANVLKPFAGNEINFSDLGQYSNIWFGYRMLDPSGVRPTYSSAPINAYMFGNGNVDGNTSNLADIYAKTIYARGGSVYAGYQGGSDNVLPSYGYHIYDLRNATVTPAMADHCVQFYFSNADMPDYRWFSVIHVRGWNGSYNTWQLAGPAHNTDQRTTPLYVRSSNTSSTWGSWRKIYDSSNVPTASELGFGTIVTHAAGDYIPISAIDISNTTNLGLDGSKNAFGYISGLTKATWNYQQTDGFILRHFYNASWKFELYADYRTGRMSVRGKNNGTWQSWRRVATIEEATNSKSKTRNVLLLAGPTVGNNAADMISGTAGLFSYGDGGPQIVFSGGDALDVSGGQSSALIWTADDAGDPSASTGVSWHFVSDQPDWNVTSKRFHARTAITIGTDKPVANSYNLYVTGNGYFSTGITSAGFSTTGANKGYRAYDQAGTQYAIIYDNGSNLWVGAEASNVYHHKGQTYISSGWTGTLPTTANQTLTGNPTIFISVPKYTTNAQSVGSWNHTPYSVLHSGNYTDYTVTKTGTGASGTWAINASGYSNTVYGIYTGNGGVQAPNYFGKNRVGFLMSNVSITGDTHYKNIMYMDCYSGTDVGGVTALAIDRTEARAWILQSDANRTAWNNTAAIGVFTATPTSGQVVITDGTTGGIKSSGYTIAKSVPSNADFTNTWRGIQDNLTSSSNTTESLSAKQGYLLANGSARDSTKVLKTGDTMSGNLTFGSNVGIVQTQNSGSNYTTTIKWWTGGTDPGTYGPEIGQWNTGGDSTYPGRIIIMPYHKSYSSGSGPWGNTAGLCIEYNHVYIDGTELSKVGHTHNYLPTTTKYAGSDTVGGVANNSYYLGDSTTPSTYKLRYINSNDVTTWTTSSLAATDSIAVIRGTVTDAWTTGHIVTFNVASVGTPFQIGVHDSSELYFYKRYKTGTNTWSGWTKMNAGNADIAAQISTQAGTANAARVVFFADNTSNQKVVYDTAFTYNPSGGILKLKTINLAATTGISYTGTKAEKTMISFKDNTSDGTGNGIVIGGGGLTIIGGGESASTVAAQYSSGGNEDMYVANDGNVYIVSNLDGDNGWANRKTFTFNTSGDFTSPRYIYANYFNQSSGAEVPGSTYYIMYADSNGWLRKSTPANASVNLTPYEAKLLWGGTSKAGSFSPVDAGICSALGANRLEFAKPAGIKIYRATNGISNPTWSEVSATDAQKLGLFSMIGNQFNISASSTAGTGTAAANNIMMVQINSTNASVYTQLEKFIINVTTGGAAGCFVKIKIQSKANDGTNVWSIWDEVKQNWIAYNDSAYVEANTHVPLAGDSGWNVINVKGFITYSWQTQHYLTIQLIFGCTANSGDRTGLGIINILGYGGNGWICPSNLAKSGHIYTYDTAQNAFFPAEVRVPTQLRVYNDNYGAIFRVDANNIYLLPTNANNPQGSWSSLIPFYINNSTGKVTMTQDAYVGGNLYARLSQRTNKDRQSTANLACTGTAAMQLILSTGTMTTGKPMTDGFILDFDWDNTYGDYRGQLFVPNNGNYSMQWRGQTGSTDWSAAVAQWKTLVDSSNFKPYKSITQRYFEFTGAGWRRIMTIRSGNSNGYVINDIKIFVRRQYNSGSPESFSVHIINNYDSIKIRLLHAEQYVQLFDGIRVSKSSDSKYQYIELNYTSAQKNSLSIRYDIISPYTTDDTVEQNNPTYPADGTLAAISDSPTPLASLLIPTGISQFNLRQVNGWQGGYFGMADATGGDSAWIRTTSNGLIPYTEGVATTGGNSYLGTSGWYFKEGYISKVYANTIDCEGLAPRHTNEINFKSPGSTLWFGYRIITDDKGSGTTSPSTPINTYLFGCGKANTEFASLKCKTVMLAPGTNGASYAQLTGGTLTATRTINAPDSSGTMSVSSVALTSTGTDSGYVDVPTGSRYLIVEVKIAATSVKSFHKVAIDTSVTSTSLIQTTTKGQYGLQLTIQPVQFVLSGATAITGGTRYLLTMNAGSVMSISAGTTPSAASATPQIVKVYAQA